MPSIGTFFCSVFRKRTPPVSGHLPLVPGVSAHGRFDYTHQIITVIYFMWCVKGCLGAAVFDNCACAILEVLTPVQRLQQWSLKLFCLSYYSCWCILTHNNHGIHTSELAKRAFRKTSRFWNVPKWSILGQFAMAMARPYGEKWQVLGGKLQSAKRRTCGAGNYLIDDLFYAFCCSLRENTHSFAWIDDQ